MSRQTALDNINLKATDRWAHTEYSLGYHKEYLREITGHEPDTPEAQQELRKLWQLDFTFLTNDGLHTNWGQYGRATDMGHAVYAADGSDRREIGECPFKEMEDVWAFDAVKEYGLPDRDEQIAAYQKIIDDRRAAAPDMLTPGGYYKTIVSGAIAAFGWDMFLLALSDPKKMEPVFDSIFRRTLWHMECWAETDVEAVIQHDDFVWSEGAFMNPEIYRKVIIPRYAELWKPIRKAGKKLLFCSDANFTEFAEDVVEAGADGLIFEPMNDFDFMFERFGQSVCLVGSFVDCRDLTLGHWDKVKEDIDKTFKLLEKSPGAILATGNHLPANIPDEMMARYIAELLPRLSRI